ncbi:MAG TPA: TetR/AcrR family transcriptional regulator [Polyangiaceae bacterium]|nr:TetR/AcrR family transcriptional regulator [Polyangiaceae bacterium]
MKAKRGYQSDLRAQQTAATRELLIKTTAESFVPWSTDVSFEQVAAHAGVSVRTVFRHFPTQLDLMLAVVSYVEQRCGWKPDELTADNLAEMSRNTFAYFGELLERGKRDPVPVPEPLRVQRARRIGAIEQALAPLTKGMEPKLARGVVAAVSGLTRIQFLRDMHEQWGLGGEDAGKAVEWVINALLGELRERQGTWNKQKSRKAPARARK